MNLDDMARVRVVPPRGDARPYRLCDVEVSSDRGQTWAPLALQHVTLESSLDDLVTVTLTIPAVPDLVEVEIAEASS